MQRVLAFLLLALASVVFAGHARATCAAPYTPAFSGDKEDKGAAYQRCMTNPPVAFGPYVLKCEVVSENAFGGMWRARYTDGQATAGAECAGEMYEFKTCPTGTAWNDATHRCEDAYCKAGEHVNAVMQYQARAGQVTCAENQSGTSFCEISYTVNPQGGPFPGHLGYTYTGNRCNPDDYSCPTGYFKDTNGKCTKRPECSPSNPYNADTGQCEKPVECPAGEVKDQFGNCVPKNNECPAGKVKAPDGKCIDKPDSCPAGQAKGSDGTCKKDEDGDGKPDSGEDTKTFSGGDTCDAPPACAGDNIMCGQARIQWRIDCNTRRNVTITGGTCEAAPQCQGEKCDQLEYSQLLLQWRATCALEKQKSTIPGGENGAQPEWTKVPGMSQDPGAGARASDTDVTREETIDATSLNTTAIVGGGGTCPGFPAPTGGSSMSSSFLSQLSSPPPLWCNLIGYAHSIIILLAVVGGLTINLKG